MNVRLPVIALLLALAAAGCESIGRYPGQRDRERDDEMVADMNTGELVDTLEHLEYGLLGLRRLDRDDAADLVARAMDDLRREIREREEHGEDERRAARFGPENSDDLRVMRFAVDGYMEAEREDLADAVERVMHAREMDLEGREDSESMRIRENAPGLGDQVELFGYASNLWREWGHEKKAARLRDLADRRNAEYRSGREQREDEHGEGGNEHDRARRLSNEIEELDALIEELRARLAELERRRDR